MKLQQEVVPGVVRIAHDKHVSEMTLFHINFFKDKEVENEIKEKIGALDPVLKVNIRGDELIIRLRPASRKKSILEAAVYPDDVAKLVQECVIETGSQIKERRVQALHNTEIGTSDAEVFEMAGATRRPKRGSKQRFVNNQRRNHPSPRPPQPPKAS